jgi:hypothetical protein
LCASLLVILTACQPDVQTDIGPDSGLIGAWVLSGDFLGSGGQQQVTVQINRLSPQSDNPNIFDGTGCMQSGDSGGWAPLKLRAELNAQTENYSVNIYSTLLAEEFENGTGVIRLIGETGIPAAGEPERITGNSRTALAEGSWTGERTTALTVDCPAWDQSLVMHAEVGLWRDIAFSPPFDETAFMVETNIVSSKLRVLEPDGEVTLIPYHPDIFSYDVDFVNSFLFRGEHAGTPVLDEPYNFFLLDSFDEPIPGIQEQESYRRCGQGAPINFKASFFAGEYLEISWDAPGLVPDEFDPEKGNGCYQIIIEKFPANENGIIYLGETKQTTHHIPWHTFEPGSAGQPDGINYGISLSQFDDGQYVIKMATYNFYDAPEGEIGFDCRVEDSRHDLLFSKQGETLSTQPGGAISGYVMDKDGKPLSGIAVEFVGSQNAIRDSICTTDEGFFLINHLPLDSYTLSAGGFGTEDCEPNSYLPIELPTISLTVESPIQEDQNFTLVAQ